MGSDILCMAPPITQRTPHPTWVPALRVRLTCPNVRTSFLAHTGPHFILGHLSQVYTLPTFLRLWCSSLGLHLESNFLLGWYPPFHSHLNIIIILSCSDIPCWSIPHKPPSLQLSGPSTLFRHISHTHSPPHTQWRCLHLCFNQQL